MTYAALGVLILQILLGGWTSSNYAALARADSATLGQLMLNCRQIAQWQTVGFRRMKKDNRTKEMVERHYVNSPATLNYPSLPS